MVGTKCPTGCSRMDHIAPPENKEISVRDFLHEETKPPSSFSWHTLSHKRAMRARVERLP
jgi:hypothetical protein